MCGLTVTVYGLNAVCWHVVWSVLVVSSMHVCWRSVLSMVCLSRWTLKKQWSIGSRWAFLIVTLAGLDISWLRHQLIDSVLQARWLDMSSCDWTCLAVNTGHDQQWILDMSSSEHWTCPAMNTGHVQLWILDMSSSENWTCPAVNTGHVQLWILDMSSSEH